ncbi:MAG: ribosomal assembly protein [Candidatus Diapherotrites archaeon]|nr:ribosomal assembly protein [Candidatus Diapherotrites archaeon]MDN5366697.1 ribosomal assembly protein [Candidatus Diapherotrites archaeon]
MDDEVKMRDVVKVPKERIGAVIGKKGRTRKKIERAADVKINVDSESGEVEIVGNEKTLPENFYKATLVVKAIGRGFDDRSAMELFADDRYLEVIDLTDLVGRSRSALRRQKARLIGREGSARKKLEVLTGTKIRVYGKTVSIIGDEEGIETATRAIERLVGEGSPHNVVFRDLEINQRKRKQRKLLRDLGFVLED